jgi:hypothetical protein
MSGCGEKPVYVIAFPNGSLSDDVKAKAEAQLGKVTWLEYTSTTEGLIAPRIVMFQAKPSAEALMTSMGKLVADIAAAK